VVAGDLGEQWRILEEFLSADPLPADTITMASWRIRTVVAR
jgi:hypothetical protein